MFARSDFKSDAAFLEALRDWFAGQALIGLAMGRTLVLNNPDGPGPEELTIADEARDAVRYADAMLAARSKGGAS